jgi:hypothetical protein
MNASIIKFFLLPIISYTESTFLSDRNLLIIQNKNSTRCSSVTLVRPSNPSNLKIANRSYTFTALSLWNRHFLPYVFPLVKLMACLCLLLSSINA